MRLGRTSFYHDALWRCIDAVLCRWLHPLPPKEVPPWGWTCRTWSAFMERTRKPSVKENRSQNWCASPVITSANPNSSSPVFHFSYWTPTLSMEPQRLCQPCQLHRRIACSVCGGKPFFALWVPPGNAQMALCWFSSGCPILNIFGSPAGHDGAKMSFGRSSARHLQETKSYKMFSWNKGKSILFHTISYSHYIWLSLFLKSGFSYLELSSKITFKRSWVFIIILYSQLTSLRLNILERRFARCTSGGSGTNELPRTMTRFSTRLNLTKPPHLGEL